MWYENYNMSNTTTMTIINMLICNEWRMKCEKIIIATLEMLYFKGVGYWKTKIVIFLEPINVLVQCLRFSLPILILEDIMFQTTWALFITKHYRTFAYSSNMPFGCSSFHLQQIKNPLKSDFQPNINLCLKASKKKLHKKILSLLNIGEELTTNLN